MRRRFDDISIDALAKRFCKICPYCDRKVPSISFFTKYGCVWCDSNYNRKKTK